MIPELKAKLWTARTPDRWHPIHVAGTDNCVVLVAPDQRELAKTIEGLWELHEKLVELERLVEHVAEGVREPLAIVESHGGFKKSAEKAERIVRDCVALLEGSK